MDERNDLEKLDDVILPGFRFHPTDEELVGFYLKRKVVQKPLSIELIRQLNIYKYDPWDLPKLATTGEKEWYFYCPRDRKYRNSARPNRVTGAGFWKATGTDRPIYSSEGTKCIGLKKSLVFYKGRAAKGIKTDWMMHEFRLPSITDPTSLIPKRPIDKNIPANDSWAICRIFKKNMAHRALSQSWVSPLQTTDQSSNIFSLSSTTTDARSTIQFSGNTAAATTTAASVQQQHHPTNYPTTQLEPNPYKPMNSCKTPPLPIPTIDTPTSCFMFSTDDTSKPGSVVDVGTMLMNLPSTIFEEAHKAPTTTASIDFSHHNHHHNQQLLLPPQPCSNNSFSAIDQLPHVQDMMNGDLRSVGREMCLRKNSGHYHQWANIRPSSTTSCTSTTTANSSIFPASVISDAWGSNLHPPQPWDSPPCPSEMSASYSSKFAALD